ncbi:MAG: TonB-dependent receptor, partial [Polyangiaceae bacterium]|nr:TonB-dependent receptor [Polyangiaceae bacterium]
LEASELGAGALAELSLEELLSIEVTTVGRRVQAISDAPGVVRVITREEIDAYGANTLRDVLLRAAHVNPIPSYLNNSTGLGIRGDTPNVDNHILYLIDGRPMRAAVNGSGHEPILMSFPVSRVERIEIVRGPGSVLYGSTAYTGVINILTRDGGEGVSADLRLAGGSFGTGIADGALTLGVGKLRLSASVYAVHSEGWLQSGYDSDGVFGSGRLYEDRLAGTFSLELEGLTLDVFAGYSRLPTWRVLPIWPRPVIDQRFVWADLGYGRDFLGEKLRLEAHVTTHHSNSDGDVTVPAFAVPIIGGTVPFEATSTSILGEVTLHYAPIETLRFIVGGTADNLRGQEDARPEGPLGEVITAGSIAPFNEIWWSGYAQGEYTPIERLTLIAGLQLNKPRNVDLDVTPRAGLVYRIGHGFGLKALYGRAFRNAYPFERNALATGAVMPNPGLEPEHIDTVDLELSYAARRLQIGLVGFYSRYDYIDLSTGDGPQPFVNFAQDDRRQSAGVELEVRTEPIDDLHLYGAFTYARVLLERATDYDRGPRASGRLGVRYSHSRGFRAGAFYTLYGRPAYDDTYVPPAGQPDIGNLANLLTLHATLDLSELLERESWPGL